MSQDIPDFREIAKLVAETAHTILMACCDDPLDGDQTEEISVMFREEMDYLNGNDNQCSDCLLSEDDCDCTGFQHRSDCQHWEMCY